MLNDAELLEFARRWIERSDMERSGSQVSSTIEVSPQSHSPKSISWILEGPDFIGQIVIWGDGQAEVDLADVATGEVLAEHKQIPDRDALSSILEVVHNWVVRNEGV